MGQSPNLRKKINLSTNFESVEKSPEKLIYKYVVSIFKIFIQNILKYTEGNSLKMGQFPYSHYKICKYLWPLTLYYVVRSACTQSLLLLASIIIQIVVIGPREIFLNWVAKLKRIYSAYR